MADLLNVERRLNKENPIYLALKNGTIPDIPWRVRELQGSIIKNDGTQSKMFNKSKYQFMLDAPFEVSNQCCSIMKKHPIKTYAKQTGKVAMTAQIADESRLRKTQWLSNGCNGFNMKHPISNPMSFWTEQDILTYIRENNIQICSVYGDVVPYYKEEFDGQIGFDELGVTDRKPRLKTTGCERTGCMFCGFGCHMSNDKRFVNMRSTHPKQYEWIMKPTSEGGLGYKDVIDWINEHGNMNIKY